MNDDVPVPARERSQERRVVTAVVDDQAGGGIEVAKIGDEISNAGWFLVNQAGEDVHVASSDTISSWTYFHGPGSAALRHTDFTVGTSTSSNPAAINRSDWYTSER